MKPLKTIILLIIISGLLCFCERHPKVKKTTYKEIRTYNQAANQLVLQLMANDYCNCILENSSPDYSSTTDNHDKRNYVRLLSLGNKDNIDSILRVADNFIWDKNLFKKNNIKIIGRAILNSEDRNDRMNRLFKECPKGLIDFKNPILDKDLKTAIIMNRDPFSCFGYGRGKFKLVAGKWISD
ncbi:MAG: hypothetical protein EOO99_11830 [Pedobacter sp.]|nr:MAG: hypothetical protein EOO99_11830 [Pedobacter sp.]